MTPEIITRSFSSDQSTFDKVFFENYYGIKGSKDKTFCDIGAHAGYFSFTAVSLGAKKVYAFEPHIDNFNILLKNCYNHSFLGKVTPYQLGVYTAPMLGKFAPPKLVDNLFFDLAGIGLVINQDDSHYPCHCTSLTRILQDYCFNEHIDVLKINIGYAEKEILTSSTQVLHDNVVAICGEVTCNDAEFLDFKKTMGLAGFINCYSENVKDTERVKFKMSQTPLTDNFI